MNRRTAWRWVDGDETVTATWLLGGWPRPGQAPAGPKEFCREYELPGCRRLAEWKVERRSARGLTANWYCVRGIPSTETPPRDAEKIR